MFISRKKFNEMKDASEALLQSLNAIKDRAYLIGIEREGRTNKFTFVRNDTVIQIETMGLITDNLPQWKEDLLR